ncbi:MAG: HDOD domain-containing protein [Phycisphaerales bacterium]
MVRALVISKCQFTRETLTAALKPFAFEVATATDERSFVETASQARFDLYLIDADHQRDQGFLILRHRAATPTLKGVPVMVIASRPEQRMVLNALKLGASSIILKGHFTLADFLARANDAIAKTRETGAAPKIPMTPTRDQVEVKPESVSKPSVTIVDPPNMRGETGVAGDSPDRREAIDPTEYIRDLQPLISAAEIERKVAESAELPPLSPSLSQLMKQLSSPDSTIAGVTKLIRQDPVVAIKVLKLANSAAYRRAVPVDTIEGAVKCVGLSQLKTTLQTVRIIEHFGRTGEEGKVNPLLFWEHSIACGLIAAELARITERAEPEHAFTLGVFHDIGRLLLAQAAPKLYRQVMEAGAESGISLDRLEQRMLMITHADVLVESLKRWRFAKELVAPLAGHHDDPEKLRRRLNDRFDEAAILILANRMSKALLLGHSGDTALRPTHAWCEALGIGAFDVARIEEQAAEWTNDVKFAMVAQAGGTAWPDWGRELREKIGQPVQIQYVSRAPNFDSYRMLCDRLFGVESRYGKPIGVLHAPDQESVRLVVKRWQRLAAQDHGHDQIPVVLLAPQGVEFDEFDHYAGPSERLFTPTRIEHFVDAIARLGAVKELSRAA